MTRITLEKRMYSVPETAKIFGVSTAGLWNHIRAGRLQIVKLGRRTVISPRVLEDILNGEASIDAL